MDTETPAVKTDPTPEELAKTRLPETLAKSEKEVFEGRIKELEDENADLKEKLAEARKPREPREPKKKSWLERITP